MFTLIHEVDSAISPEVLAGRLRNQSGLVVLRTAVFDHPDSRCSLVTADPFMTFRSTGDRCELIEAETNRRTEWRGNPWQVLDELFRRFESPTGADSPFPLGGCFGYWGFDLKEFVEPSAARRKLNDLRIPDCQVGFFDSLVVFDHRLNKTLIVSTGLGPDGSRSGDRARERMAMWWRLLESDHDEPELPKERHDGRVDSPARSGANVTSNMSRDHYLAAVAAALRYIRAGDIYQVNLAHRLSTAWDRSAWELFERLTAVSPAPFSAYLDGGDFQIVSSSPELFLKMSGSHITTRPIKGTRPRAREAEADARLNYELVTSPKETAELVMITDLLRNDLGKICEFGSVRVSELFRVERYSHVQHLVSTIEGQLRRGTTHLAALASSFPGGSITGAPKIRAMQIIDQLESVSRGPYTGALGYAGFNGESQFSILIRAAICQNQHAHFHVGAGIVADSIPEAEYAETLAKAGGFFEALNWEGKSRPNAVSANAPN